MSDLGDVKGLLDRLGIGYMLDEDASVNGTPVIVVELRAKEHAKVEGYTGFVADFTFKPTGEFIHVGVYE